MEKIRAKYLKPGDLWHHGRNKQPWIFVEGKEFKCPISKLTLWQLTWFGRKNSDKLELIVDNWTSDSKFLVVFRSKNEQN